ncbi:unnamed protein product [Lota lota]
MLSRDPGMADQKKKSECVFPQICQICNPLQASEERDMIKWVSKQSNYARQAPDGVGALRSDRRRADEDDGIAPLYAS